MDRIRSKAMPAAFIIIPVILIALAVHQFLNPTLDEPVVDGKSLSYYLNDLKLYGAVNASPRKSTAEAIRQMGDACLPHLKYRLESEDHAFLPLWMFLEEKYPSGDAPRLYATPSWVLRRQALRAIPALGYSAEPLIPSIINLFSDPELCYEAGISLSFIGNPGIEALVNFLNREGNSPRQRAAAIYGLGHLSHKKRISQASEVLTKSLDDSSDEVLRQTLIAIRNLKGVLNCEAAVAGILIHENPAVRREAELTLGAWANDQPVLLNANTFRDL